MIPTKLNANSGLSQNFKGKIEIDETCKDKNAISKALTKELTQKVEELPDDYTLQFSEFNASLLENPKSRCLVTRKESLTTDEYVKRSVDKAKDVYKEMSSSDFDEKVRKLQQERFKELDKWIKTLEEFEEKESKKRKRLKNK